MACRRHYRRICLDRQCRAERNAPAPRRSSTAEADPAADLANPLSPLHQATYGGSFYGADSGSGSSDCGSPPSSYSSGYDSGSSSGSYDSGSSSSSSDSGSSGSCD